MVEIEAEKEDILAAIKNLNMWNLRQYYRRSVINHTGYSETCPGLFTNLNIYPISDFKGDGF
jgi:hypothetical protein